MSIDLIANGSPETATQQSRELSVANLSNHVNAQCVLLVRFVRFVSTEHCVPSQLLKGRLMKKLLAATFVSILSTSLISLTFADEAPANSDVALEDSFDRAELGKGWNSTTGEWKIVDGVLTGREIAAEKHSAATRKVLATQNAVYQLKFRLTGNCRAFHFGFDPARGELDKKGHLFSVIVTPKSWQILKHIDKNRREEDPNEKLAEEKVTFEMDQWYTLRVTTWGTFVTAKIDDKELKASHKTFGVKKPTLVFRCLGDGVEIDDIKVWTQQ